MAEIRPFRAMRYDRAKVGDLSRVVTQPYDRIPEQLQARYYAQHPFNFVRLILNQANPQDSPIDNVYTRANHFYGEWLADGTLARDTAPSLYVYHQTFTGPDGERMTRRAFMALLRLTEFGEGTVLPHERTLSGPKVDRLNLFRATAVNFEPVFLLYPDPGNRVNEILSSAIAGRTPAADLRELYEQDVRQQLWPVSDPDTVSQVVAALAPLRNLIIADGHHRYETALTYRDERRAAHQRASVDTDGADPTYEYVLVSLVSIDDPGLVILPTHRLVHSYRGLSTEELLQAAAAHFEITPMAGRSELQRALAEVRTAQRQGQAVAPTLGLATPGGCYLWRLSDPHAIDRLAPDHIAAWRELDVSILHELVLEKLLGLSKESIAGQQNLRYLREPESGFDSLDAGQAQFLFLLNPTRMAQVRACAEAGEKMPQKSTDFYPKMISGLVVYPLR